MVIYFTDFCMSKLERHGSVEYEDICHEYNNRTIRTIPWMKEAILYVIQLSDRVYNVTFPA
jgi:hypothetical protein